MRLGCALPHYGFSFPDGGPASVARTVGYARRAEDLGFSSVWVSDHLFLDLGKYGGPDRRFGTPEAMTTLAAVGSATRRVRPGVLVACVPLRPAAVLGAQAATLHDLCGGRFDLGVGAGWYEAEFDAAGVPFGSAGDRIRALARALPILREALGEDRPPIWVGGKGGPKLMRVVAEHGDGWNLVWRATPESYAARLEVLRRACDSVGRDPSTVRLSLGLACLLGSDRADLEGRFRAMQAWAPGGMHDSLDLDTFAADTLTGTPQECAARLKEFEVLGVEEVILGFGALPFAVWDDEQMELAARELAPLVG